jgi:lipase chaperone LimK
VDRGAPIAEKLSPQQPADPVLARWGIPQASLAPFPASLRGTRVDGSLAVDAEGRFRATPDTLRLFEYFFSASGEEPDSVIRGRIALQILDALPGAAGGEAMALLDRYLGYREAARELLLAGEAPEGLERRWQWIRELRREHFGAELTSALFAEEEQTTMVDLQRRELMLDPVLSESERADELARLEERLPERIRESRRRATAPLRARQEVERLQAAGASEVEIFAARAAHFGPEAARRLAELDRRRAEWDRRLADYGVARDELLDDTALDERERAESLERIRGEYFTPEELPRIRALDRVREPR